MESEESPTLQDYHDSGKRELSLKSVNKRFAMRIGFALGLTVVCAFFAAVSLGFLFIQGYSNVRMNMENVKNKNANIPFHSYLERVQWGMVHLLIPYQFTMLIGSMYLLYSRMHWAPKMIAIVFFGVGFEAMWEPFERLMGDFIFIYGQNTTPGRDNLFEESPSDINGDLLQAFMGSILAYLMLVLAGVMKPVPAIVTKHRGWFFNILYALLFLVLPIQTFLGILISKTDDYQINAGYWLSSFIEAGIMVFMYFVDIMTVWRHLTRDRKAFFRPDDLTTEGGVSMRDVDLFYGCVIATCGLLRLSNLNLSVYTFPMSYIASFAALLISVVIKKFVLGGWTPKEL